MGLIAASLSAAMVAVYSINAAVALLSGRQIGTFENSGPALIAVLLGAAMLTLSLASLTVAYGLMRKRSWAQRGGIAVFSIATVALVATGLVGITIIEAVLPLMVCVAAIWSLLRPEMRIELGAAQGALGQHPATAEPTAQA